MALGIIPGELSSALERASDSLVREVDFIVLGDEGLVRSRLVVSCTLAHLADELRTVDLALSFLVKRSQGERVAVQAVGFVHGRGINAMFADQVTAV